MKRSAFRSKLPAPRHAKQVTYTPRPRTAATAVSGVCAAPARPVRKQVLVRSEPYRRLVAALPCIYCGVEGRSQHAHGNTGKGAGLKVDDRFAFPLCADQPVAQGCHSQFDQGLLFPKAARRLIEPEWARRTALTIFNAGVWPAGMPLPDWMT